MSNIIVVGAPRVLNGQSKAGRWACGGIAAICLVGCMDEKEARYANAQEAKRSDAGTRGWIPDVLPDDAVDIRELHNIDTNQTWGCFKTAEGLQHVRDRLQVLGAKGVSVPLAPSDEAPPSWWPQNAAGASEEVHQVQEGRGMILRVGISATKEVCFHRGIS